MDPAARGSVFRRIRERLPGADRRDLGAGYAAAVAAVCVVLLFSLVMVVSVPLGVGDPALSLVALTATPLVVPAAFLSTVAVWRVFPMTGRFGGLLGGLLATVVTYLVSLAGLYLLVVALAFGSGPASTGTLLAEAGGFVALVGFAAFLWTFWLTIPIGCLGGAAYERTRSG